MYARRQNVVVGGGGGGALVLLPRRRAVQMFSFVVCAVFCIVYKLRVCVSALRVHFHCIGISLMMMMGSVAVHEKAEACDDAHAYIT